MKTNKVLVCSKRNMDINIGMVEANINLLDLLIECDARYPYVREYVADICRPSLSDN